MQYSAGKFYLLLTDILSFAILNFPLLSFRTWALVSRLAVFSVNLTNF